MATSIVSFGYKHGHVKLREIDSELDIRMMNLHNPWSSPFLRGMTGLDPAVQQYIEKSPDFDKKVDSSVKTAENTEGILYIGCSGGKHRSVYLATLVGGILKVPVIHRDL
jgi:UPF0042 nucleotide-binding protein